MESKLLLGVLALFCIHCNIAFASHFRGGTVSWKHVANHGYVTQVRRSVFQSRKFSGNVKTHSDKGCIIACCMALIIAMVLCTRSQDSLLFVSLRRVHVVFSTAGFKGGGKSFRKTREPPRCDHGGNGKPE